ncbi:hypothetical protein [Tenacibaculum aquimarinum]|uniref:hypothetical protein n=1 Tax=Tenacibaculum aquimarinum TaxID=2910675 RepID=UPI001F0B034A|nr:hypothetical protein [Tenacibaculum aquimarinum]MCH3883482.1 hypothetical protein [Tenacibaculum aquimarinum]
MKSIELNQMENLHGGGFWDGLCGTTGIASGVGLLAIELAIVSAIPGLNIVVGIAAISCGIAALT